KSYEAQTQELLRFKHDYDKVLKSIASLIDNHDYDAIKGIVKDSNAELDNIQVRYKKYSNNLIVDALLNDYQKRFSSIGVVFDSLVYLNMNDAMTDINLIKLFYNILENAYESLTYVDNPDVRLFKIESTRVDAYMKISFMNTMNPLYSSLDVKTTK